MADYKDSLVYEVEISDDSLDTITAKVAKATAAGVVAGSSGIGGGGGGGSPGAPGGTVRGGFGSTGTAAATQTSTNVFASAVQTFSSTVTRLSVLVAAAAAAAARGGGAGQPANRGPGMNPTRGGRGYTFGFGSGRNTPWGQFAMSGGAALGGPGGMLGRFAGYAMGNYPGGRQMVQQRRQYMTQHGMANTAQNRRTAGGAVGRAAMGQSVRAGIGGAIGGNAGAALMAGGGAMGALAVGTLGVVTGMKMLVNTLGQYNATTKGAMVELEVSTMKMKRALSKVLEPLMTGFTKLLTALANTVEKVASWWDKQNKKDQDSVDKDAKGGFWAQVRGGIRGAVTHTVPGGGAGNAPAHDFQPVAIRRARGGIIPGFGTDTVPTWLTPGEFVVNRKSAKQFAPQLMAMNHMAVGGWVPKRPHEITRNDPYHAPDPNSRGHGYLKNPVSAYSYRKKHIRGGTGKSWGMVPGLDFLKNWTENLPWALQKQAAMDKVNANIAAANPPMNARSPVAGPGSDASIVDINRRVMGAADAGANAIGAAGGGTSSPSPVTARPPMPTVIPSTSWDGIRQNITVNLQSKIMHEQMMYQELMKIRDEIHQEIGTFRDETRLLAGLLDCGLSPGM